MRKKRILCVLLMIVMALAGCQKSGSFDDAENTRKEEQDRERDQDDEDREEEEDETREQQDREKDEEEPAEAEAEAPEPINLDISGEYDSEWLEGSLLIQASSSKLQVLDEGYESFQAVLDEYNARNWNEVKAIYDEFLPQAREQYNRTGFAEYEISRTIVLARADSLAVSFTNGEESYLGGAHGSHYISGVNFDPASGKLLSLKDVAEDYDKVYEYTKAWLEREYGQEAFFPDYQDTLKDMFYGDSEGIDPLEWSMDREGVVLYFNQYVLGPYSSGAFMVEIPSAGEERLLKGTYFPAVKGMMKKVQEGEELFLDVNGDGQDESFSYTVQKREMDFSSVISVQWGQQKTEKEVYGWIEDAYLVQRPDGRTWFYAESLEDNDWRSIHVFDLNQGAAVYVDYTNDYIGGHLVDNPENFVLYTRMDILGTYTAFRRYQVGENGIPEALDSVYTIINYDRGWGEYAITSKVELTVQMYADGGMRRVDETLPAGTKFYLRRTDGKSFVEMELEDGRRCDILFETEDYFSKINGINESECFDGLMYAG